MSVPGRFVILHHTGFGREHWDLMLERGESLATWQLLSQPQSGEVGPVPAVRIGDHRKAYLEYEGPVSGGRGQVQRFDHGEVVIQKFTDSVCQFWAAGRVLRGDYELRKTGVAGADSRGGWLLQKGNEGGRVAGLCGAAEDWAMNLADNPNVAELIALAQREDLGGGDLSSQLLPNPREAARFHLLAKQPGIFCGREIGEVIVRAYDPEICLEWTPDGVDGRPWSEVPAVLATLHGPIGPLLSAERVLLNFLQRLCGVATRTRGYVDAIAGTGAKVYDTRKTVPGWRALEKYAVRCGGGHNHRMGLYDAVLIKDNHLCGIPAQRLSFAIFEMLNRLGEIRQQKPTFVQVECADLEQFAALLDVIGIDSILLDNFAAPQLREAVELRDDRGLRGKLELEASGGITLQTIRAVAETGVERISVGAITHSATAIDLCLDRE